MGCSRCPRGYADSSSDANWWATTLAAVTNPVASTSVAPAPSSWVVPVLIAGAALLIFWGTLKQGR